MKRESPNCGVSLFDAKRLITLRTQRKLTQSEVASGTGLERYQISLLESGKTPSPSFRTIAKLADFFKVNMETFKKGTAI